MVSLDIDGLDIQIRFPYSKEQVERVKTITSDWRKAGGCWLASCSRLEEIYEVFPDAKTSDKLREWMELQRRLAVLKEPHHESPQPHWVECELRPHQKSAVEYLDHFSRCGNFDPAGGMKTRTAVAWALHDRLPALVVCPATVKYHWRNEVLKCRPSALVYIVHGNPKAFQQNDLSVLASSDFVVLNHDLLRAWLPLMPPVFRALLIDEGQNFINSKSQRGGGILQSCESIPNVHYMTASPSLKRNGDVESMLIGLGYLKPKERFPWRVRFCNGRRVCVNEKGVKYHGKDPQYRWDFSGSSRTELLTRELDTFSVRRPSSAIKTSMPSEPVHTLLEIDLVDMREHARMFREMKALLKSNDLPTRGKALALFGAMLTWVAAAKHDTVLSLVTDRLDAGESPVVFADFHAPLDALRTSLNGRSMSLDGRMPIPLRERVKQAFVDADKPLCLLCSRPGVGTGTDGIQHKARTVIFQSLPVRAEYFKQAYKRVAREGQTQPVEVITVMARGTIDEAVLTLMYESAEVTDIICSEPALTPEAKADWERALKFLGGM